MSLMIQHLDHARLGESLNYYGRRGGQLSMENFKGLAAMGHQEAALRQVVADAQRQGLSVDPELNQFLSSNTPLGTKYSVSDPASFYRPGAGVVSEAPRPTGGVFDLNQNDLAQELVRYGIRGGSLSMGDFQRLVGMGHTEAGLLEAVRAAANKYVKPLGVDADLRQYLDTGTVSERGDLEGFPGFKDTKGTAFQNTFEAMTADAETRIVRDPETREVLGYTESAGVVPLPGQEITLYDNDKQNIIGKATMPTIGGVESDQPAAPTVKYFDQPIPVDETGTPAEPEEVVEPTEPTAPERPGLVMPGIDSPVTPLVLAPYRLLLLVPYRPLLLVLCQPLVLVPRRRLLFIKVMTRGFYLAVGTTEKILEILAIYTGQTLPHLVVNTTDRPLGGRLLDLQTLLRPRRLPLDRVLQILVLVTFLPLQVVAELLAELVVGLTTRRCLPS